MMKPVILAISLIFNVVYVYALNSVSTPKDTIGAIKIFNRSESVYAHLKVYLDSGKLIQTFIIGARPNKTAKIFHTAYKSNGAFNFEYYEVGRSNSLYTVNRSSGITRSWFGTTNVSTSDKDLSMALSAALGVSSSTSTIIPGLLLTHDLKTQANIFHTTKGASLAGIEPVNSIPCYKITGNRRGNANITFWISTKDFLIRKIETETIVNAAKNQAQLLKIDSLSRSLHKNDTAYLRKDSLRKARTKRMEEMAIAITKDAGYNLNEFKVKDTYTFTPYTRKTLNPVLFKFRPNREVAL